MIEMGKKYQTRKGQPVRILCTDLQGFGAVTVVGLITQSNGSEWVGTWTADGRVLPDHRASCDDLVPVPTKHEGWVLVQNWSVLPGIYRCKEHAEEYIRQDSLVGAVPVLLTWEI